MASLDLREASLIGRLTDIVKAKYRQKDFYGPDVTALDVPLLHANAQPMIRSTRNPHVLLVIKEKFQAAGCAAMMQNFGCRVTVCFNGREAYTKHLRRNAARFDLAIVEWDMPDVNGRDLVHYCRSDGSTLCFLALVANEVLPGMAIRGGANLFLRSPLCIHMHVIRKLLLPPEITGTGFPTHVLVSRSHFPEMSHVLGTIRSRNDDDVQLLINEAIGQLRDAEVDDHDVVDTLVDNLKRALASATTGAPMTASDHQVARLQTVVRNVLSIARDTKTASGKLAEENRSLRSQLKECLMLHRYVPLNDKAKMEELESFSKTELKQRISVLQRQQIGHLERIDKLTADCAALTQLNGALDKALECLQAGDLGSPSKAAAPKDTSTEKPFDVSNANLSPNLDHTAASFAGKQRTQAGTMMSPAGLSKSKQKDPPPRNRFMSMADLRASFVKKPRAVKLSTTQEIAERLENALMAREDLFSMTRPNLDAVPINISWSTARAVPLQDVYLPVARIMEDLNQQLNLLSSRLLASYPKVRPRLVDFAKEVHALFNASPPAKVFVRSTPQITAAESSEKSPQVSSAASPSRKVMALKQMAIQLLLRSVHKSQLHRFYTVWKLFRVMRRGFVSSIEEERLMRKTRANKELAEARTKSDKLEVQLAHANSVIRELKLQIDAAWQPSPLAPLQPLQPASPARVPGSTRSIGLSPIPWEAVAVSLPPPRAAGAAEVSRTASSALLRTTSSVTDATSVTPARATPAVDKASPAPNQAIPGKGSQNKAAATASAPVPPPASAPVNAVTEPSTAPQSTAPPPKAAEVNVEVPVAVVLRTAPPAAAAAADKKSRKPKGPPSTGSARGNAGASSKQKSQSLTAQPAPPVPVETVNGEEVANRVVTLEKDLQASKAAVEELKSTIAQRDERIDALEAMVATLSASQAARRRSSADGRHSDVAGVDAHDVDAEGFEVDHATAAVAHFDGVDGAQPPEVTGEMRAQEPAGTAKGKRGSRRSVEFMPDDGTNDASESSEAVRKGSVMSASEVNTQPVTQLAVEGPSPTGKPAEDAWAYSSVVGSAECVLERKTPNVGSPLNPFLTKPLATLALDEPIDETLAARPSLQSLQPQVSPRGALAFLDSVAAPPKPPIKDMLRPTKQASLHNDALSSFLPQLTPRPVSTLSPTTTALKPDDTRRSPLPPVQSKPIQSPRQLPMYSSGSSAMDTRDSLKTLLMAQSARGPQPSDVIPVKPSARSASAAAAEQPTPAQAKKLFAKLGIGQMPKINPKPQQLSSDFALTGRR